MSKVQSKRRKTKPQAKNPYLVPGLIAVLVVAITGIWMLNRDQQAKAGQPKEISTSEAFARREAGAFILDVREPEEWQEYHIPGSTLVPLGDLESRLNELPQDQEIVVVCRSGNRSQAGRDTLLQAGFTRVTSMAGGLKEWSSAGYPTVSGN